MKSGVDLPPRIPQRRPTHGSKEAIVNVSSHTGATRGMEPRLKSGIEGLDDILSGGFLPTICIFSKEIAALARRL